MSKSLHLHFSLSLFFAKVFNIFYSKNNFYTLFDEDSCFYNTEEQHMETGSSEIFKLKTSAGDTAGKFWLLSAQYAS